MYSTDFPIDEESIKEFTKARNKSKDDESSDVDPRSENLAFVNFLAGVIVESLPPRTSIIHTMPDGRTIGIYKDLKSVVWYQWRKKGSPFSKYEKI